MLNKVVKTAFYKSMGELEKKISGELFFFVNIFGEGSKKILVFCQNHFTAYNKPDFYLCIETFLCGKHFDLKKKVIHHSRTLITKIRCFGKKYIGSGVITALYMSTTTF